MSQARVANLVYLDASQPPSCLTNVHHMLGVMRRHFHALTTAPKPQMGAQAVILMCWHMHGTDQ